MAKKNLKMVAQDMSIYGMMFRKRSHVSTKFTQMTYVKSSDPTNLPRNSSNQIPPSLRLAVEKVQVIETFTSAEAVECCGAFCRHGGTVDTEAAAVVAAEDVHSIGHVAPDRCVRIAGCGRRSARGQLTPAIGLPKVAEMY